MRNVFDFIPRGRDIAAALAQTPTYWSPIDLSDKDLDEVEASCDAIVADVLARSPAHFASVHMDACRLVMLVGRQLDSFSKVGLPPYTPDSAVSQRVQRYLSRIHAQAPHLLDPGCSWPCLESAAPGGITRASSIVVHLAVNDVALTGMQDALREAISWSLITMKARDPSADRPGEAATIVQDCIINGRWNFVHWLCGDQVGRHEPTFIEVAPDLLGEAALPWLISAVVAKGCCLDARSATEPEAILLLRLAQMAGDVRQGKIALAEGTVAAFARWEGAAQMATLMADAVHLSYKEPRAAGNPQFSDIGVLLDTYSQLSGLDRGTLAISFMQRLADIRPSILGQQWAAPIAEKTVHYLAEAGFDAKDIAPGLNVGRETMEHLVLRLLGPSAAAVLVAHSHCAAMNDAVAQALSGSEGTADRVGAKLVEAGKTEPSELGTGGEQLAQTGDQSAAPRTRRMKV